MKVSSQFPKSHELSEQDKYRLYSEWYYICLRLLTDIEEFQNIDSLSEHSGIPKPKVSEVVEFLIQTGLVVEKKGRLICSSNSTHIPADSPLSNRHHINWRLRVLEKLPNITNSEIAFTGPITISKEAFEELRMLILDCLKNASKIYLPSEPEMLACLNINLLKV